MPKTKPSQIALAKTFRELRKRPRKCVLLQRKTAIQLEQISWSTAQSIVKKKPKKPGLTFADYENDDIRNKVKNRKIMQFKLKKKPRLSKRARRKMCLANLQKKKSVIPKIALQPEQISTVQNNSDFIVGIESVKLETIDSPEPLRSPCNDHQTDTNRSTNPPLANVSRKKKKKPKLSTYTTKKREKFKAMGLHANTSVQLKQVPTVQNISDKRGGDPGDGGNENRKIMQIKVEDQESVLNSEYQSLYTVTYNQPVVEPFVGVESVKMETIDSPEPQRFLCNDLESDKNLNMTLCGPWELPMITASTNPPLANVSKKKEKMPKLFTYKPKKRSKPMGLQWKAAAPLKPVFTVPNYSEFQYPVTSVPGNDYHNLGPNNNINITRIKVEDQESALNSEYQSLYTVRYNQPIVEPVVGIESVKMETIDSPESQRCPFNGTNSYQSQVEPSESIINDSLGNYAVTSDPPPPVYPLALIKEMIENCS